MAKYDFTKSQKAVIESDGNLLVSASAGSGKTTVMLEKVLELLKSGYDISKILIMTFSRASAAEMKEKFISKLCGELRKGGNEKLKAQLEQIAFAQISTIDSFCFSLFKKYYAEIGHDPVYELLDENEAAVMFLKSCDAAAEEYLASGDKGFLAFSERFGEKRSLEPVKLLAKQLSAFLDLLPDGEEFISRAAEYNACFEKSPAAAYYAEDVKKRAARICLSLEKLENEMRDNNMDNKYYNAFNYIYGILHSLRNTEGFGGAAAFLADFTGFELELPRANKKAMGYTVLACHERFLKAKSAALKFLKTVKSEFEYDTQAEEEMRADTAKLAEFTLKIRSVYAEEKKKKKKLDFADLSKLALKLLDIPRVQAEVSSQYVYAFVDEYQDTNYVQEALIEKISPQNLFTVGDPKQAIYQFRSSEPEIFLNRSGRYRAGRGGKEEFLNDNFRSDKRILDFINLIFNEVMTREFGGTDYKLDSQLQAGREYPESPLPAVEVIVCEKPGGGENFTDGDEAYGGTEDEEEPDGCGSAENLRGVYSVKEGERLKDEGESGDAYIAEKICALVSSGTIYDADAGKMRKIEYRDITVLMYKGTKAAGLLAEMKKRSVPYSAAGFRESVPYETGLLINILRAVENFQNDIPLAAVMLSPVYSFTPEELLEIRRNNRKMSFGDAINAYTGDQTIENKIRGFISEIESYRAYESFCDAPELMWRIMNGRFGVFAEKRGKAARESVCRFIKSAEGKAYARCVAEFIEYFDGVYKPPDELPSDANAVNVMTVHKSKGLEFPIVFLARAHRGFSANYISRDNIFTDRELGIALKSLDTVLKRKSDTPVTLGFKAKKEFNQKQELLRIMYVALTRAKNHLFIVGGESPCKDVYPDLCTDFMGWISLAAEKNPAVLKYRKIVLPPEIPQRSETAIPSAQVSLTELDFRYPFLPETEAGVKYTVTELTKSFSADDYTLPDRESGKELFRAGKEEAAGRISSGVLYHRMMELADYNKSSPEEVRIQAENFAAEGLIDESVLLLDLKPVSDALSSPFFANIKNSKILREQSFMMTLPLNRIAGGSGVLRENALIQGVIDLIVLGGKNMIIDFKASQSGTEEIRRRYKLQLELYSEAAEEALGIKIHEKYIYVLGRNEAIKI